MGSRPEPIVARRRRAIFQSYVERSRIKNAAPPIERSPDKKIAAQQQPALEPGVQSVFGRWARPTSNVRRHPSPFEQ